MQITKVEIYNIRKHKHSILNLSPYMNRITGENGKGKTDVIKVIDLVLFGTAILTESEADLISQGFDKGYGKLWIKDGDRKFLIERYLGNWNKGADRRDKLYFKEFSEQENDYVQSKLIGKVKDAQAHINQLLNLSPKMYKILISLGVGSTSFAESKDKRALIDELLGLMTIDEGAKKVSAELKRITEERQQHEKEKDQKTIILSSLLSQVEKLKQIRQNFEKARTQNIETLEETISICQGQIKDILQEINTLATNKEKDELKLQTLQESVKVLDMNYQSLQTRIQKYQTEFQSNKNKLFEEITKIKAGISTNEWNAKRIDFLEEAVKKIPNNISQYEEKRAEKRYQYQCNLRNVQSFKKLLEANVISVGAVKKALREVRDSILKYSKSESEISFGLKSLKEKLQKINTPYVCTFKGCSNTFEPDKAEVAKLENSITKATNSLEAVKSQLNALNSEEAVRAEQLNKLEVGKKDYESKITDLEKVNEVIKHEGTHLNSKITEKETLLIQYRTELEELQGGASIDESQMLEDLESQMQELLLANQQKMETFHVETITLKSDIESTRQDIKLIEASIKNKDFESIRLENTKANLEDKISESELKLKQEQVKTSPVVDADFDKLTLEIKESRKAILLTQKALDELATYEESVFYWKKGFSNSGIKSYINEAKFPLLNNIFLEMAEEIGFLIELEVSQDKKRGYIMNYSDKNVTKINYDYLNAGHRSLCDIYTALAFHEIKNVPFVFLDEILNNTSETTQNTHTEIILRKIKNKQTIFISHALGQRVEADKTFEVTEDNEGRAVVTEI